MSHTDKLPPVLDVCCGTRSMWFTRADDRTLYLDNRCEEVVLTGRGQHPRRIAPDLQADFTRLPFPGDTFSLVVFDPPHVVRERAAGNLTKLYGCLTGDWRGMLRRGFAECFRVLKPEGTLIFKWAEAQIPLREILALTPEKPLFGHQSRAKTHWVAFLKASGFPAAQGVTCDSAPSAGLGEI
jgi:SAM-dependent methyltransferase